MTAVTSQLYNTILV